MANNNNNVQGPPPAGPNFSAPDLRAARTWLEKEPPNSITTWNDLVSKFVNQFFPPSRTTNLRNEITRFQQRFDETFSEDYLNSTTGGNLLTRNTQEALTIIENTSKVRTSRNKTQVSSASGSSSQDAAIITLTKQVEALGKHISSMNKPIHSIQDSCDSCGGPHSSYECQAINNMNQEEVYAYSGNEEAGTYHFKPNYNPDNLSYRILAKALQERPQGALPSDTVPNPRGEIKAITTRSGIVFARPSLPPSPLSSSFEEVERDTETITDQVLPESSTRVPPPVVQPSPSSRPSKIPLSHSSSPFELPKRNPHQHLIPYPSRLNKEKLQDKSDIQVHKFLQIFKKLHFNISLAEALALMPKYAKMLKYLLSDKEKLLGLANTSLTENCSAVLLKKLPKKLGDPMKFLIPCDFPELEKCMALANLGASINLMPFSVWKKLMLPELIPTRMTLELANKYVAYPAGIAEDIWRISATSGKFTFLLTLLSTTMAVDPRLTTSETSDYSLEEFADELALLDPFPPGNEDDNFDPKRFTDEPALVYSFPPGDDDDDLFYLNKDLKIECLIDDMDDYFFPILPTSRSTLLKESSEIATLLSSPFRNEDKVFNPCILILGGTQIFHDKSKDKDLNVNSSTEALLILMENNFLSHSSDRSSDRELPFFLESTVIEKFKLI
ncbi:reverse transcriptase domain-containing protein [Tanacetum coccineum]